MTQTSRIAVLIVAAGRGIRAGGSVPKQYRPVAGRPLVVRTVEAFRRHPAVGDILLAIHPDDQALVSRAFEGAPPAWTPGGETRQESVRLGLEALAVAAPDLVFIHDAARPFVTPALIDRVLAGLADADGAIPVVAVSDTIKEVQAGRIAKTVPRDGLYRAQTPQGFRYPAIRAAHDAARSQALTDDAAVAEAAGLTVLAVEGDGDNVKITEAEDFAKADARCAQIAGAQDEYRIGSGFDVHSFGPGDHIMLCGVRVPHAFGLVGHSDADAGLHALTDALLGAIGAGDIGQHFPPSDPQWKGAASDRFLAHAAGLVAASGGSIVNADITVICERPKVGPHRAAMVARVAEILGIAAARVSVKATTTEELGFTGRREGLAAQAVVSVRTPRR